jgi:hypothetical protein
MAAVALWFSVACLDSQWVRLSKTNRALSPGPGTSEPGHEAAYSKR